MKALLSFFSGFPISWYIIGILAGSLSLSIYVLQGKIEEIGGYKVAQDSYVAALESSKNQLEKKDLSCKIDSANGAELEVEKQEVQSKVDVVVKDISSLKSGLVSSTTEAHKNAKESNVLYGPELLSLDLRILLDKSYCLASPDDINICGSTGQSAGVSLPINSGR